MRTIILFFNFCVDKLGMKDSDFFIVLNPDVFISNDSVRLVCEKMKSDNTKLSTINLYKDEEYSVSDDSIRKFPSLYDFATSFLGLGNSTIYNKNSLNDDEEVDWAAGSFLAFKVEHFKSIRGFDENYFMYCEDIDICFRSYKQNNKIHFYKNIKAIHFAKHNNRKIFSSILSGTYQVR